MNHRLSYSMKIARACVAVAAAYALALQILLASAMGAGLAAGMTVAPGADGVICYGSRNTNSGNPQPSHSPGFADCALACATGPSAAAILPPDMSPAFVSAVGRPLEQAPAADVIRSRRLSPKLAQGPPQNA